MTVLVELDVFEDDDDGAADNTLCAVCLGLKACAMTALQASAVGLRSVGLRALLARLPTGGRSHSTAGRLGWSAAAAAAGPAAPPAAADMSAASLTTEANASDFETSAVSASDKFIEIMIKKKNSLNRTLTFK
jgi:hypothetical protein